MRLMERYRSAAAGLLAGRHHLAAVARQCQCASARQEDPIPASPGQDLTAIQRTFSPPTQPPAHGVFPELRERWKDTPPSFAIPSSTSTSAATTATRSRTRRASVGIKEAWAGGGSLSLCRDRDGCSMSCRWARCSTRPSRSICPGGSGAAPQPAVAQPAGATPFGQLYAQARLFENALCHGRPISVRHAVPGAA